MELARVFAESGIDFDATLVFITVAGEEQGLVGAGAHAKKAKDEKTPIQAWFNNDIVGGSHGGDGVIDSATVRVYSEGPEDSASRSLAIFAQRVGGLYVPSHQVRLMARRDRFSRGGDHSALNAEGFAAIGAKTTLIPGGEVFSALEKGTVDAADYTGPAVNWDLGFQQVTKFIWTGPPGLESVYQPVDLMDFVVRMDVWNKLSPKMKEWLDDEIQVYSNIHHAAIQKADMEAWGKFEKAGVQINRLPAEDLPKFQRVAVPIWFKWANKDPDAAKIFKMQLDVMESHTCGYVTPDMYKGLKIGA
jgi:hypothetical protein